MNHAHRNANLLLLLAAAIWGFAFVAQRVGMQHVGPLTFNGVRFLLGAAALWPLAWRGPLLRLTASDAPASTGRFSPSVRWGLVAGLLLFCGATFQQVGVVYTTAGKAGFITGLYVLFVPLFGLLVGKRTGRLTWVGAVLAAVGLYLLSAKGITGIALGDGLVLLSAVFWALHVLAIDRYVHRVQPLQLAATQFAVCGALSVVGAFVFETPEPAAIGAAALPILYAGLLSTGVAYTLQVVAQRKAHPSHAAIILSLESVFAVLGGWLILSESLSVRGLAGCGLMLAGMLLAQLRPRPRVRNSAA